ncbi:MAG: hypothetical protein IPN33_17075 [Saprospiraceae bacterium]|nr:hypothetical protein [Saprospiraceae bacterium]
MKRSSLFIAFCFILVWQAQAQMKPRLPQRADATRRQVEQITLNPIKPGIPTAANPFVPAFVPKAHTFTATTGRLQNAQVTRDPDTGLPVSIIGAIDYQPLPGEGRSEALAHCIGYLETIKDQLKLSAPAQEFVAISTTTDELGITHVRMQQVAQEFRVWQRDCASPQRREGVYDEWPLSAYPAINQLPSRIRAAAGAEFSLG